MMLWQILALVLLVPLALFLFLRWVILLLMQEAGPTFVDEILANQPVQKHAATAPMPLYMQLQLAQHQKKLFDTSHSSTYQQFAKKRDYS